MMKRGWWLWAIIGGVVLLTAPFLAQRAAMEQANRTVEIVADLQSLRELSQWVDVSVDVILKDWAEHGVTAAGAVEAGDIAVVRAAGLRVVPRTVEVLDALLAEGAGERSGAAGGALDDVGPFIAYGEKMPGYPDELTGLAERLTAAGIPLGIIEFANQAGEREMARLMNDVPVFVHSIPRDELQRLTDRQALARFNRAALERQARVLYVHALLPPPPSDGGTDVNAPTVSLRPEERAALLTRNDVYVSELVGRMRRIGLSVGKVRPLPRWESSAVVPAAAMVAAAAGALLLLRAFVRVARKVELAAFVAALVASALTAALLVALGREVLFRQLAAFSVAAVFPALAVAAGTGAGAELATGARSGNVSGSGAEAAPRPPSRIGGGSGRPVGVRIFDVVRRLALVTAVTSAGAVLVVAALADSRFFLKLEQFRGVKLAHVVPLALAAAVWAWESVPGVASFVRAAWAGLRRRVLGLRGRNAGLAAVAGSSVDAFPGPGTGAKGRDRAGAGSDAAGSRRVVSTAAVGWRHAAIAAVVAAALFVLVARTGHHLLPVSPWERGVREALEEWLVVRPRTKEFLFGYPALLVGLALFARGRRKSGWPFVVAGSVASISVINTFSHAHVGLGVSAIRSVYGLLLGVALGAAALAALALWESRRRPRFGRPERRPPLDRSGRR